jgi:hypothetical protein
VVQVRLTNVEGRLSATNERIELHRLEPKVERHANRAELKTGKIAGCDLGPVPKVKQDPIAGSNARLLEPCRDPRRQTRKSFPAPFLIAMDECNIVCILVDPEQVAEGIGLRACGNIILMKVIFIRL